jgi:hypothetical protein
VVVGLRLGAAAAEEEVEEEEEAGMQSQFP